MAFITFVITGIIAPGQFDTTSTRSAKSTSLLVGTKEVSRRLHKSKTKIRQVLHRKQNFAHTRVGRNSPTKNHIIYNNGPKHKEIFWNKKEIFEELLKAAGIQARYFCRRSFAISDVLLLLEDLAKKLAGSNISSKYYRLQPEYVGARGVMVIVAGYGHGDTSSNPGQD